MRSRIIFYAISAMVIAFLGVGIIWMKDSIDKEFRRTRGSAHTYSSSEENEMFRMREIAERAKKLSTLSEAFELFPQAKFPKNTLGRKLEAIYFFDEGTLNIDYENRLRIAEYKGDPREVEESYKQFKKFKENGWLKSDSVPGLVEVSGIKALGVDPGYNIFDDGGKDPRSGFVTWCDGGTNYNIYDPSMSLEELLVVANSMY